MPMTSVFALWRAVLLSGSAVVTLPTGSENAISCVKVEATTGFEPVNRGFADLRVEPLHHVARCRPSRVAPGSMAAPRGFEPRFTAPKSAVLPLDEGAAGPSGRRRGAEDGTRTRDPHLGKVMLYQLSHFRSVMRPPRKVVPRARFELATPRFSVACSTN